MFVTAAYAQTTGATGAGGAVASFLPLILIFAIMYFLLIRPQQKKMKDLKAMIQAKIEGKETVEPPVTTQLAPVIDIMEALKMSLQNVKKPAVSTAEADDAKPKKVRK